MTDTNLQELFQQVLGNHHCQINARLNQYDFERFNLLSNTKKIDVDEALGVEASFQQSQWAVAYTLKNSQHQAFDLSFSFRLNKGASPQTAVGIDLNFSDWSTENYVLLPAAAYNGNRFESRRISYSPKLLDPRDIGAEVPPIVSDVPRLNINPGPSRIQERTGSMSVPSIGFFSPKTKTGFFLLTEQQTRLGDSGIDIEESRDRQKATITLTAPVVRQRHKYRITDMQFPSDDKGYDFETGDQVNLNFKIFFFDCQNIQELFNFFAKIRNKMVKRGNFKPVFPFSSCFEVIEEKFNRSNFDSEYGYYAVGMKNGKYRFLQDWQIGWTGGMISTYALLNDGNKTSEQNVIRNFEWLFPNGISPSGFFYDAGEKGSIWYGGDPRKPHTANWHLIRKSGDALFYIIKQFRLMAKKGIEIKPAWEKGTQGVANAFVRLWDKWQQFGNFVDSQSGDVAVGGSASAGIAPAALCLAAEYFGNEEYLRVARQSGEYFYENFVRKGFTTGGPGDAMQNPDSESAYGVLESFVTLFEYTNEKKYLQMAEEMAVQFTTWVMGYDYEFPESTLLGKLGIQTTGTVCANTQNKHGAPGICTHSGNALFRLFRATENPHYAQLLKDIAGHIPQNLSHPERPIKDMPIGWVTERVSTTDWLEGIGEIMYGSTWAETALMLTYTEVPGIYANISRGEIMVFDQIGAKISKKEGNLLEIEIFNPTKIKAKVKVLAESSGQRSQKLPVLPLEKAEIVEINPSETKTLTFKN